ncbi:MAG: trigger factor family protein, partial [Bacteroidetes bacterium]|nr:trigger factor family protein [Bacteroidota bacterium]
MNISLEKVDSLNAIINIEIQPEDYSGEIEKGLKSMQQRANFPGFRKGKAPMGMVRKIYGTQIRTDEVFKKLNSELFSYLETEKVQYLGEPLPNESKPDSNN